MLPYLYQGGNAVVAPYLSRHDGLGQSIPNICFKVPTGGGKTLLATAALERVQTDYFKRQTGLVLWVVPSEAIYRQTWKQLANREHPYRQMLERASGGRVKMLEKGDAFTRRDVEGQLCVMLLMLPSAARKSKETLRLFRDSGRFTSFFPVEDDSEANRALLDQVPNLDQNDLADMGFGEGIVPGSISIKQSLGNVLRLVRPVVVIDEGTRPIPIRPVTPWPGSTPLYPGAVRHAQYQQQAPVQCAGECAGHGSQGRGNDQAAHQCDQRGQGRLEAHADAGPRQAAGAGAGGAGLAGGIRPVYSPDCTDSGGAHRQGSARCRFRALPKMPASICGISWGSRKSIFA